MAKFPENSDILMEHPQAEKLEWKTLISQFDDLGEEKRKSKRLYPRRNLNVKYANITKTEARTLWNFFNARKGRYEAFNFFLPHSNTYTGEYVGTGDGSTVIFNLPSKQASGYTLYVNGVAKTGGGVDYTFSSQGGADGADKVTFTTAPADGERITFDFTGYLKVRCRFAEDKLDFETFYDRLVNMGIKLKGLLNQ